MNPTFIDTSFWIAVVKKDDKWNAAAMKAYETLKNPLLVTTDEVLTEFLNHLSRHGETLSKQAAIMVRSIIENPNVKVIPQTRDSFLRGLKLYENSIDKGYSLTDCVSMNVMKAENINDALSSDLHFEQADFNILIKTDKKDS